MGSSARAHADDPLNQALNYNTPLNPREETAFQEWALRNGRMEDLRDYDLRGFWKSGEAFAPNGHGSDRWKKPNHPTFSAESIYSGPYTPGGVWEQVGGRWRFRASPHNLRFRSADDLRAYFGDVEPDVDLILPEEGAR